MLQNGHNILVLHKGCDWDQVSGKGNRNGRGQNMSRCTFLPVAMGPKAMGCNFPLNSK
jgi:hypothetical protein